MAVTVFEDIPDTFACAELACPDLDAGTFDNCKRRACPFAHQRQREEAAVKDDAAREKERRAEG